MTPRVERLKEPLGQRWNVDSEEVLAGDEDISSDVSMEKEDVSENQKGRCLSQLMPDVDRCQSRIGYTPYPQAWT